jgi:predicted nucleic acid-binding protein
VPSSSGGKVRCRGISILSFDLDATLRWLKPHRHLKPLSRRSDGECDWIDEVALIGQPILLDTTVYIDVLQRRAPPALKELILFRICNHSAVCLAELSHVFGRLNPFDHRTSAVLTEVEGAIREIPSHRLTEPDAEIWGAAGILAGMLFRLGAFPAGAERKCLNDALVYLQARKQGWVVVTANLKEFDFLNQLVPDGRILLYRRGIV